MVAPIFIGAGIVISLLALAFIFGITAFFSTKIFLLVMLVGILILGWKFGARFIKGGAMGLVLFVALIGSLLFVAQYIGLLQMFAFAMPDLSNEKVSIQLNENTLSAPEPMALGIDRLLTPQTYRKISVTIKNSDPSLPLVIKGDTLLAFVYPCENKTIMEKSSATAKSLCNAKAGQDISIPQGEFRNFVTFFKQVFGDEYKVGISENNPRDWNSLNVEGIDGTTRKDDLDFRAMKVLSDPKTDAVILWSPTACSQYGDYEELTASGISCASLSASEDVPIGYAYALKGADYGTYTVKVLLLEPHADANAIEAVYNGLKSSFGLGTEFTVVAVDSDKIQVTSPLLQILLVIGGIGIILAMLWQFKVF